MPDEPIPPPPPAPPHPAPRVAVVVLHYNREDLTEPALRSLEAIAHPGFQIILVDNGSTDGSGESLALRHPACTLARIPHNIGFAGGANHGFAFALERGAEFILFASNDTEVDPGILGEFLGACGDPGISRVGLCVPKVFYATPPGAIWYAGGEMDPATGLCRPWGEGQPDGPRFSQPRDCTFGNGCVMFLPASTLRAVGMLDTSYHHTGEDTDFSIRLRRAGLRILFVPGARVWHKVRASFSRDDKSRAAYLYYEYRNRLLIFDRHFRAAGGRAALLRLGGFFARGVLGRLRRGDLRGAGAILRGWRDGRAGVTGRRDGAGAGG